MSAPAPAMWSRIRRHRRRRGSRCASNLHNPDGSGFSLAVMPYVSLPTGQRRHRRRRLGRGCWCRSTTSCRTASTLALTAEADAAVDADGSGRHLAYSAVFGLGAKLTEKRRRRPPSSRSRATRIRPAISTRRWPAFPRTGRPTTTPNSTSAPISGSTATRPTPSSISAWSGGSESVSAKLTQAGAGPRLGLAPTTVYAMGRRVEAGPVPISEAEKRSSETTRAAPPPPSPDSLRRCRGDGRPNGGLRGSRRDRRGRGPRRRNPRPRRTRRRLRMKRLIACRAASPSGDQ